MTDSIKLPWPECFIIEKAENGAYIDPPIVRDDPGKHCSNEKILANAIKRDQAIALYRGAKMILELSEKSRIWHVDTSPYREFWEAIELLRKGIGE